MISHAHLPSTFPCLRPCLPPAPNLWLLLLLFHWFHYGYNRWNDADHGNWLANFSFDYVHYSWKKWKNEGLPEPVGRIAKTSWPRQTRFKQIICSSWKDSTYRKCLIAFFIVASMFAWFDNRCLSPGLSESLEVDGWVVKVSSQSRDILFKKRHP